MGVVIGCSGCGGCGIRVGASGPSGGEPYCGCSKCLYIVPPRNRHLGVEHTQTLATCLANLTSVTTVGKKLKKMFFSVMCASGATILNRRVV